MVPHHMVSTNWTLCTVINIRKGHDVRRETVWWVSKEVQASKCTLYGTCDFHRINKKYDFKKKIIEEAHCVTLLFWKDFSASLPAMEF